MNEHLQSGEIDLFALGALEGEDRRAVESHLKDCPVCRKSLEGARARLALVLMTAPAIPAPGTARHRLLERVERKAARQGRRAWLAPVLAAACVLLAVGLGIALRGNGRLRRQVAHLRADLRQSRDSALRAEAVVDLLTSPRTLRVQLVSGHTAPQPQGRIFFNDRRGVLFYAANLPAVPSTKTYQLWLVPQTGKPVSLGIMQPDRNGNAELISSAKLEGSIPAAFAVTLEPARGVPQPTGPKILVGLVR